MMAMMMVVVGMMGMMMVWHDHFLIS